MKTNYFRCLLSITFLIALYVMLEPSVIVGEELESYDLEMNISPLAHDDIGDDSDARNILDRISGFHNNLYIGRVGIKPSYQINEVFDDNVFNTTPGEKTSDFYTLHQIKIGLVSPLSDHSLAHLDYDAEVFDYYRVTGVGRINQSLKGALDFRFANDFNFGFSNKIRRHVIPPGVQRRFFGDIVDLDIPVEDIDGPNVFVDRREVVTNIAHFYLDFPKFFQNLSFSASYKNRDVNYQTREFKDFDFNTHTAGITAEYNHPFLPISFSSGFFTAIQRYDARRQNSNTKKTIPFDVEWKINHKHEIYLNTHYKTTNYVRESNFENFQGWEVILGYRYIITPVSTIEIFGDRSIREQRRVDNNSYFYTAVGIKYTLTHNRFVMSVDTSYFNIRFFKTSPGLERVEEVNGVMTNLNIRYNPQEWWFAEFSYNYYLRDNVIDFGDFDKNMVSLGVGVTF